MKFNSKLFAFSVFSGATTVVSAFSVQLSSPRLTSELYTFSANGSGFEASTPTYVSASSELYSTPAAIRPEEGMMSPGARQPAGPLQRASDGDAPGALHPPGDGASLQDIWNESTPIRVQGDSLKTWSLVTPEIELVQVMMKTEGRPLNANVELWQGPDNTPQKMSVYVEDGSIRPFSCVIATPREQNAIAVYNTGHIEFPLDASVEAEVGMSDASPVLVPVTQQVAETGPRKIIQGGAIQTFPYAPDVDSVAVILKTDGRPLNARLELMQGPNNNKQVIEIYTEDGLERPFFTVIETPGVGNVVRVVNTGTIEFPLTAIVAPYMIESGPQNLSRNGHFFLDG